MSRKLLIPLLLAGLLPLSGCCSSRNECQDECQYSYGYSYAAPATNCPATPHTEAAPPAIEGDTPAVPAPGVDAPPVVPNTEQAPAPATTSGS